MTRTAVAPSSSAVEELQKLVEMRNSGALTEAEFTAMKAKIVQV
jgi:hypothetical protein